LNNVYQNIVTPNIADKNGWLEIDFGAIILTICLPQQISLFQLLDTKHYFVFVLFQTKKNLLFLLMAGNSVKRTLLQFLLPCLLLGAKYFNEFELWALFTLFAAKICQQMPK
jgi:hypothetical protein